MANGSKFRLPAQGFFLEPQSASKAGGGGFKSPMFPDLAVVHQLERNLFWANFGQRKEHLPANFEDFARFKEIHIISAEEGETSVIEYRWPLENFFHEFIEEGSSRFSDIKLAPRSRDFTQRANQRLFDDLQASGKTQGQFNYCGYRFSLGCVSLAQGLGIKYQRKGAISQTGSPAGL